MIPYFVLILVPLFFSVVEIKKVENRTVLCIGRKISRNNSSLILPVFFILLLLLLALRDETIGRDLPSYKYYFEEYSTLSIGSIFNPWQESLFRLTDWIIARFTLNYQIYLAIIAIIEIVPIAYIYCQEKTHGYLKMVLFVNMSTFVMLFSGLRQSLAMAIGMVAYIFVKKRKLVPFLIFAIVAALLHHSGFMVFLMYPLYYLRLKKKHLFVIVPSMIVVLVFNQQLFSILTSFLSDYSEKYDVSITSTGAFGALILFSLFLLFSYVISDENKLDTEGFGLRNYLVFAVLIQCFAPLNYLAMRMNYYYILFIPLAIGKCLDNPRNKYKSIANAGEFIMCAFFTLYFVYSVYNAYITGISQLDTIPYIPFWKN